MQHHLRPWFAALVLALGCDSTAPDPQAAGRQDGPSTCGPDALADCARPKQSGAYYVDQAMRYFDALDVSAPADRTPTYAELVVRWEWPPWLKLTGYTATQMELTDKLVKQYAPAVVSHRDCRAFDRQPFARCRVSFDYTEQGPVTRQGKGKNCFIYEEFVFNDKGEMTFVEAWSDLPGLTPITDPTDPWGERTKLHRLSMKVPGLGSSTGHIALDGPAMQAAAQADPEIADFVARAQDFWPAWTAESEKDPDYFQKGCGW
jgi:hypothetical protein